MTKFCYDLETYFFNETKQFVLVCQNYNSFELSILDYDSFFVEKFSQINCSKKEFIFILIIISAIFQLFIMNQLMIMI